MEEPVVRANQKLRIGWILLAGLSVGGMALAPVACSGSSDGSGGDAGSTSSTTATGSATTSAGGSTGSATSGSSGSTASTSSTSDTTWLWAFNDPEAGLAGWNFNTYQTSADPFLDADNGIDPNNLSATATLTWDSDGGTAPLAPDQGPVNGMMSLTVPFSAYNQKADFHITTIPAAAMDLSASTILMWVKLDAAPDGGVPFSPSPSAPGGFVIYIKTGGAFVYGQAAYKNITATSHDWALYTFDVKNKVDLPSSPAWADAGDPTDVVEIGFYIHTGGGGNPDGGPSPYPNPTPATFHIDSIGITPSP
jgi:hypothetical protein